jgi:hypothetical protein
MPRRPRYRFVIDSGHDDWLVEIHAAGRLIPGARN